MHNDVALVTNVSADHLGLRGIRTLDQLAEVKSTILRITRPDGWDVLNADDPRVLEMRRVATGRPWLFSMDPDHPALRWALEQGGRATTVIDGRIAVLARGRETRIRSSRSRTCRSPSPASRRTTSSTRWARWRPRSASGIPERAVVKGLRTFVLDPERNPGRTNLFELDGRVVVVDYAHNEAGMRGLVEVCRGLRRPGAEIWLTFGTAGDRTDEILHGLGVPGRPRRRPRRRSPSCSATCGAGTATTWSSGSRPASWTAAPARSPVYQDEVTRCEPMLRRSSPGDVVAITALAQRPEVFALLDDEGATQPSPARVRQLVRRPAASGTRDLRPGVELDEVGVAAGPLDLAVAVARPSMTRGLGERLARAPAPSRRRSRSRRTARTTSPGRLRSSALARGGHLVEDDLGVAHAGARAASPPGCPP